MEIEYAVTRLKAARSRFPSYPEFIRILQMEEASAVSGLLSGSIFAREMDELSARGAVMSPPLLLRVINAGGARLRRMMAQLTLETLGDTGVALLMKWEIEELKSALRYLAARGERLDRRFAFESLVMRGEKKPLWEVRDKSLAGFIEALKEAKHPIYSAIDREAITKDPMRAELDMERYFFGSWLPSTKGLTEEAIEYLTLKLDIANMTRAMLLRDAKTPSHEAIPCYVQGNGLVTREDFTRILEGPQDAPLVTSYKKLGVTAAKGSEISATIFSLEIKRGSAKKIKLKAMLEPVGVWDYALFMEELDIMVSNLKMAVNLSMTHTPIGEAADSFIRVAL